MHNTPEISVVVPVFNEEENLPSLFESLFDVMETFGAPYEIIFTDDGSSDGSDATLTKYHDAHPDKVKVVFFNRNYGQHMAIIAAMEHASGQIIVTLDADNQNPPEEIPKLIEAIRDGHDVAGTYRADRHDSLFRRWASGANNSIRHKLTGINMRDQGCMLRAYHRDIVENIIKGGRKVTFIPALAETLASNSVEIEVAHKSRKMGESKYTFYKLFRLNFDLITCFSVVPLQLLTLGGLALSSVSFLFVIYLVGRRLVVGPEAEGVFTLLALIIFMLSIIIFGIGMVGEYVGRIFLEVKESPSYVVQKTLGL